MLLNLTKVSSITRYRIGRSARRVLMVSLAAEGSRSSPFLLPPAKPYLFFSSAFAFSPDCLHVAVVGSDGLLRIIDYTTER